MLQQMGQIQGIANASETNKLLQQHQQLQGIAITTAQAQKYDQQLGLVSQALAATYAQDNGNPTRKHVTDAVSDLITKNPGIFDKDFAAKALGDLPSDTEEEQARAQGGSAVKSWLIGHASRNQQGREALAPLLPDMKPVDVGGQIQMVDMNPRTNPKLAQMQLQKGFTPGEATAPDNIGFDPTTGAPIVGTHAQATQIRQGGIAAPGALPSQAAAPGPVPGNGLGIKTPPPGTAEANAGMAKDAQAHATEIMNAGVLAQQHQGILRNMLKEGDEFTSGPLAHITKESVSGLNEVAARLGLPQINPESVASQEGYGKFAQLLARQQLASGTNDDRASAMASNPNDALSNMGKRRMAQTLLGNADAARAKADALSEYMTKNGAGSSWRFEHEIGKNFDQRAYQLQHMDPKERQKFLENLKPGELEAVRNAFNYGHEKGYLSADEGVAGR